MLRRLCLVFVTVVALAAPPAGAHPWSCDWMMYGADPGRSFAQPDGCGSLNTYTAPSLRPKWFFPTPDAVTASPAVARGVAFVGSWDGTFYALPTDPPPGPVEPLWTFRVDDRNDVAFGRIVSSAAVHDAWAGRVVAFGGGATLYVLDAETGAELARACLDPRADPATRCNGSSATIEIESSPVFVDRGDETWILVGMDVHNRAGIGRTGMVALRLARDLRSLTPLWKFDPEAGLSYGTDRGDVRTPDPLTHGAGTGTGCGGVWSSPTVDEQAELVFFGTASCTASGVGSGETMFAVRLDDGRLVWRYSPRAERGESTRLDDDFGATANLLPGGLVGAGGKDGWYYARRRADGAPAWARHVGQAGHVSRDFAVGGIIGSPAVGRVMIGDEAYVPAVFVTTALSTPVGEPLAGPPSQRTIDATLAEDPARMFSLHAIDATDGRVLWRTPLSRQSYGAPSYVNGLLLVPSTFDASLKAVDASTGVLVWSVPLGGAPSSTPVVVGHSVYVGTGTRTTDAEWKAFGGERLDAHLGAHPLSRASGVWAFEAVIG